MSNSAPYIGEMVIVGNAAGQRPAVVCKVWDTNFINASCFTPDGNVVPRTSVPHESKRESPEQECWSQLGLVPAEG